MIRTIFFVVGIVPQALAVVADLHRRGSTWTNAASNDTSQSPTSTCDSERFSNWTDSTKTGGYMEDVYCQMIVKIINSEISPAGHWTVTNNDGDPFVELLSAHDKCYCSVARVDGNSGAFKVGNQDVVNFITQAIDKVDVYGRMHGEVGTTMCSAESEDKDSALIAFKISLHPPGYSSASSRYSGGGGLGWVALGLLLWGLTLHLC